MKIYSTLFIAAFSLLMFTQTSCKNAQKGEDKGNWALVWEDNFNKKKLDDTKWTKISRGEQDWDRYMSQNDKLVAIEDGNLVIRGMKNDFEPNDTASFLTGGVYTKDKKTFGFGRLEIKAKLAPAQGSLHKIWMLSQTGEQPKAGEIDILERFGLDKFLYQSVLSHYTQELGINDNPPANTMIGINPDKFNVYALEKYPDSLIFYVNDLKTKKYSRIQTDAEGQFPFADNEFYLLLNLQLGGYSAGKISSAQLPVEMQIDWVRYYEPKSAAAPAAK